MPRLQPARGPLHAAAVCVGVFTTAYTSQFRRPGNTTRHVRPEWAANFATAFGIPVGDLAAITGIDLSGVPLRDDPVAVELAELLWNLRRLSASQANQVYAEARAMLVAVPDDAPQEEWNRVYCQNGTWRGATKTPGE